MSSTDFSAMEASMINALGKYCANAVQVRLRKRRDSIQLQQLLCRSIFYRSHFAKYQQ
jgi:hypothetical protein